MLLIYGKGKVGIAVAGLCDFLHLAYELRDDQDRPKDFDDYEAIIPSPGIHGTHEAYRSGKVISELDFASRYLPKGFTTIAITGTDGKSTTAWIAYSILEKEFSVKKPVYLSGNFDIPFSATVGEILRKKQKSGYIVVEVSSFMAHVLHEFSPDYTIFTNFKPDHLDWHRDIREYLEAKWHLVERTKKLSIIERGILDEARNAHLPLPPLKIRVFSGDGGARAGREERNPDERKKDYTDGQIIRISGRKKYTMTDTNFSGMHNALNILSVGILGSIMRICSKRTKTYLRDITGLPHRVELVAEKDGIRYIDDSKSTSCQSLVAALTAFDHAKTILIAGGHDKGDPFDSLEHSLSGLKHVVLIGKTRELIAEKCRLALVPFTFADSMQDAVKQAQKKAHIGDTILLSPGCASFGMFTNYLDRAHQFREAIGEK